MQELKCKICGKTGFKSKSGLAGHMQIAHGVKSKTVITSRDEISNRLGVVERDIKELWNVTKKVVDLLTEHSEVLRTLTEAKKEHIEASSEEDGDALES